MKRFILAAMVLLWVQQAVAQTVEATLARAWGTFEKDSQLKSAIASLYVIDAETGKVVFDRNSRTGLAPASTQKILTAAAAYDLLGKDFRFETKLGYYGQLKSGRLSGSIVILPSGDPTLGSWRWKQTAEVAVMQRMAAAVTKAGIQSFGSFVVDETGKEAESIPGGWIWDDVGNYYGAGAEALNFRENQYDLFLKSGSKVGDPVTITGTRPVLYNVALVSKLRSAARGSGDNAYVYLPAGSSSGVVRGTIPVMEEKFVISGAMPSGESQFLETLNDSLSKRGIVKEFPNATVDAFTKPAFRGDSVTYFYSEFSPSLDSIVYWFLKKSINLYGEALVKQTALQKGRGFGSDDGAEVVADYWSGKGIGIDRSELHLYDGSGLSPQNRTTTHAQVAVLHYAKKQPWFSAYFNAFPEFNGMKLKSGTINRVRNFCGYHTARIGRQYVVSFIVNNYHGALSTLEKKMFAVLDVLK